MQRAGECFVGYGETKYTRPKGNYRSFVSYLAEAIKMALDNAGLKKKDLNGLAIAGFLPQNTPSIVEWLGLELDWLQQLDSGGAAGVVDARRAADAIQLGHVDVVVCVGAAARAISSGPSGAFESYQKNNWVLPYGFGGPNSYFALILRRYMEDNGLTAEQTGKIAISLRKNAEFNENALFRSPLTMEEYLNSRIICDPLRLYDCVAPCNGAAAFVMTSEKRAKELTDHPIYLVSDCEKINYQIDTNIADRGTSGFEALPEKLFSNCKIEEIDLVAIYDAYIMVTILQLEGLGFFEKGKAGEFIDSHDLTYNGDFPLNTGGGELSCGQAGPTGGYLHVVEAIRQLKGEAKGHQVKGAKTVLVSTPGMPSIDTTLNYAAAMILQRR